MTVLDLTLLRICDGGVCDRRYMQDSIAVPIHRGTVRMKGANTGTSFGYTVL